MCFKMFQILLMVLTKSFHLKHLTPDELSNLLSGDNQSFICFRKKWIMIKDIFDEYCVQTIKNDHISLEMSVDWKISFPTYETFDDFINKSAIYYIRQLFFKRIKPKFRFF